MSAVKEEQITTSDEQLTTDIKTDDLAKHLVGYLRMTPNLVLIPRVFVNCSQWESDIIAVRASGYWTEYELKVSVADFKKDFKKSTMSRGRGRKKHDIYSMPGHGYPRAVPRKFYFVAPAGLLPLELVPEHCGVMEWSPNHQHSPWGMRITKTAPNLQASMRLSQKAVFSLAVKASARIGRSGWSAFADREYAMEIPQDTVPPTVMAAAECVVASLSEDDREYIKRGDSLSRAHMTVGRYLRNNWGLWEDSPIRRDAITSYQIAHADDISGLILEWAVAMVRGELFKPHVACERFHTHWSHYGTTSIKAGLGDNVED